MLTVEGSGHGRPHTFRPRAAEGGSYKHNHLTVGHGNAEIQAPPAVLLEATDLQGSVIFSGAPWAPRARNDALRPAMVVPT